MVKLVHGSQNECQKKILQLHLQQTCFDSEIFYDYGTGKVTFKGICLKQDRVSFTHRNIVNLYISNKFVDT